MDYINEAYERMNKSDVKYRFVIDMAQWNKESALYKSTLIQIFKKSGCKSVITTFKKENHSIWVVFLYMLSLSVTGTSQETFTQ
jgi:hypothetical protein